jgi:predicted DNA binding CopG/RHH family protein
MSEKIQYSNEPLGEVKVIPDFLPSPQQLAVKEENVKITISLSRESVDFFKQEANKHHTQYQKMIRKLLDVYVEKQKSS